MNFLNTWRNKVLQPRRRFLNWSALFLLGMLLPSQQILAKEWEFVLPITEISIFSSEEQIPKSFIHVNEGDKVIVHIKNNTSFKHTIHWHGIHQMDNERHRAMPGMTKTFLSVHKNIEAGKNFTYRWKAEKAGTFWYHCHLNTS